MARKTSRTEQRSDEMTNTAETTKDLMRRMKKHLIKEMKEMGLPPIQPGTTLQLLDLQARAKQYREGSQ